VPIVWIGATVLLLGGVGFLGGGATGAVVAHLLYLRSQRLRAIQGAEVRPDEEFSSGCGAVFAGSLLGSALGCLTVLGAALLIARFGE
jgi:hypothetical protein